MTPNDLERIEGKVDNLTEAVAKLVLFEERQSTQAVALADLTQRLTTVEKKVDLWINRGIGAWALAATAWGLFKGFHGL